MLDKLSFLLTSLQVIEIQKLKYFQQNLKEFVRKYESSLNKCKPDRKGSREFDDLEYLKVLIFPP